MWWMMTLLLPMAYLIGACVKVLPVKYRRLPTVTGWTMVLPCLILLIIPATAWLKKSPMQLLNAAMVFLAAMLGYYLVRAASFLGIISSYIAYSDDFRIQVPPAAVILAWSLSFLEPLSLGVVFCLAFFFDYPGRLDGKGLAEVMLTVTSILTLGLALSFVFLMLMYGLRTSIATAKPGTKVLNADKSGSKAVPARGNAFAGNPGEKGTRTVPAANNPFAGNPANKGTRSIPAANNPFAANPAAKGTQSIPAANNPFAANPANKATQSVPAANNPFAAKSADKAPAPPPPPPNTGGIMPSRSNNP